MPRTKRETKAEAPADQLPLSPTDNPKHAAMWWRERLDKPRFVYFIQDGDAVKIGQAFDPAQRLAELQCGNPRGLTLGAVLLANEWTEERLHLAWRHARMRGEWFDDSEGEIIRLALEVQLRQVETVGHAPTHAIADLASQLVRTSKPRLHW